MFFNTRLITVTCVCLISIFLSPLKAAIEDQNFPKAEAEEPPHQPVLTKAPTLTHFVDAVYPVDLLQAGIAGAVAMLIDIDVLGNVERVEVTATEYPAFTAAALTAAAQFLFSPAEVDHKPSPIRIEYRYQFVPKVEQTKPQPKEEALPVRIKGQVLEAGTRRPMADTTLLVNGQALTSTDKNGRFSLAFKATGKVKISVLNGQFDPYVVTEEVLENEVLEIRYYLVRTSFDPYATVIRSRVKRKEVARVQLQRKELEKIPGTFGDPIRVIENLPGMARAPGGLGGALLVRGTNPTETKVFVDGVEVPMIYHFGGLTSVLNAGFLDKIDFFPGGFRARYGGATAGIVDVVTRDLDCDMWRGNAQVNMLDSSVFTCVPVTIGDDTWFFGAAARRSYVDLWIPSALDGFNKARDSDEGIVTAVPIYADYQLKATGPLFGGMLNIMAFGITDDAKVVQSGSTEDLNFSFGLKLGFNNLTLRHDLTLGSKLQIHTLIAAGVVNQLFRAQDDTVGLDTHFNLDIAWAGWRQELEYPIHGNTIIRAGIDAGLGDASIKMKVPVPNSATGNIPSPIFDFTHTNRFSKLVKGRNHAYWAELEYDNGKLLLIPGIRLDRFDFHHSQFIRPQPRLNARWEVAKGRVLKAAYGIYEKLPEPQFIIEDFGNPEMLPLRSEQFIVGYEHAFTDLIQLDLQTYYNKRSNIPTPSAKEVWRDGILTREWFDSSGFGATYGLELLLRHLATEKGRFYGWVAYTLSKSLNTDREIDSTVQIQQRSQDGGVPQNDEMIQHLSVFDQTHILTIVGQFVLPWGLELGGRFRYVTGNPTSALEDGRRYFDADSGFYAVDQSTVDRYGARMPAFHQLDIRVDKTWTFDLWKLTASLEVLNAYNHRNVEQYQYDYRYRKKVPLRGLPIFPVLGIKGEF